MSHIEITLVYMFILDTDVTSEITLVYMFILDTDVTHWCICLYWTLMSHRDNIGVYVYTGH